jgi:hypothetical protein
MFSTVLPAASVTLSPHVTIVSLAMFAVYTDRNIWPLLTFTLHPLDSEEGWVIWLKISLAFTVAIVLPLVEPYPYAPVDPNVCLNIYDFVAIVKITGY